MHKTAKLNGWSVYDAARTVLKMGYLEKNWLEFNDGWIDEDVQTYRHLQAHHQLTRSTDRYEVQYCTSYKFTVSRLF